MRIKNKAIPLSVQLFVIHYLGKALGVQTRPADQCTVDIRLATSASPILSGFDRTAVQNPRRVAATAVAMRFGNDMSPNMPVHFLSLFGRRGFTRADRPDRLVSDYDTFHVGDCQTIETPLSAASLRRDSAFPASLSDSFSPTQTIAVSPAAIAAFVFLLTEASVSP